MAAPAPWRAILELARRTPSPHNTQPWRVRLESATDAEVFIDRARLLPKEDLTGAFQIAAMAMFVEAVREIAANAHYATAIRFHPVDLDQSQPLIPFARLTLTESAAVTGEYANAVFAHRATSRLPYRPEPLPAGLVEACRRVARDAGYTFGVTTDPAVIENLLAWNGEAVFADLNTRTYHDEIRSWMRFSDGRSARTADGLDFRAMNLPRLEYWAGMQFSALLTWPVLGTVFMRRYRRQAGQVAQMGFLAGPFWQPEAAKGAGRCLMRVWLELAARDVYLHPFGNLITNPTARARCEAALGVPDPWIIFRLGQSDPPPPSRRRSVDEILCA